MFSPHFMDEKTKPQNGSGLAQGHTARTQQGKNLNPDGLQHSPGTLFTACKVCACRASQNPSVAWPDKNEGNSQSRITHEHRGP